jgi:hypothetical protein
LRLDRRGRVVTLLGDSAQDVGRKAEIGEMHGIFPDPTLRAWHEPVQVESIREKREKEI